MVYFGPSRGCQVCRKRRVKCDEGRPFCGACVKRKQQHICIYREPLAHKAGHPTSRDPIKTQTTEISGEPVGPASTVTFIRKHSQQLDYGFRDQSPTLSDSDSPPDQLLITPSGNRELESLCFLFANYINVPRESQSNMVVEHILPLYKEAPAGSPLRLATAAVAANISEMWKMKGPDTAFSRRSYSIAVTSLRNSFADPQFSDNTDFVLASIFMLDFYESLSRRFKQSPDMDMHLKAAMAILQQKGRNGLVSESSKRISTALRGRYIQFSLQARKRVDLREELDFIDENNDLPSARLDLILARLANLLYEFRNLIHVAAHPWAFAPSSDQELSGGSMSYELLLLWSLEINSALDQWQGTLPESWQPIRNSQLESIHYSIRAVGLYNGLCDVYSSISASNAYNSWRSNKILVLRLVKQCLKNLPSSPAVEFMTVEDADEYIQAFVDDICASVPFLLGSRTSVTLPHEHAEYPPVPADLRALAKMCDAMGQPIVMTDQDHARAATSLGGWLLLTPLTVVLKSCNTPKGDSPMSFSSFVRSPGSDTLVVEDLEPLRLRPGQPEWIQGQVKRIHKLYTIPYREQSNGVRPTHLPQYQSPPSSDQDTTSQFMS